jgi:hypothetical protein
MSAKIIINSMLPRFQDRNEVDYGLINNDLAAPRQSLERGAKIDPVLFLDSGAQAFMKDKDGRPEYAVFAISDTMPPKFGLMTLKDWKKATGR